MSETEELALYHQTLKATSWAPHNVGEDPFSFAHRSLLEGDPRKERAQNGREINPTDTNAERKSKSYNQLEETQNGVREESVGEKGGLKCGRDGQEKKVVNKRKVKTPARRTYQVASEIDCLVKRYKQNGNLDLVSDSSAEPLLHGHSPQPQSPQHSHQLQSPQQSQHTIDSPRLSPESSALLKEPHQQLLLSSQNSRVLYSPAPDPKPANSTDYSCRLSSSPLLSSLSQPQSPPRPLHKQQQQHDIIQKPRQQQQQNVLQQPLRPLRSQTPVHSSQQLPVSPKGPSLPGSPKQPAPIPIRSPRQSLLPGSPRLSPLPPRSPINLPQSPINLPRSPTRIPHLPKSQQQQVQQQQIPALLPLDLTTTPRSPKNNHQYSHSLSFLPPHSTHSHASSPSHSSSSSPSQHHHHHSQPKPSSPRFHSHSSPLDPHHSHFSSTQVYPYDFSLSTQRNCHSLSPPPNRSRTPVSPPTRQKCYSLSPPTQSTSNASPSHCFTQCPSSSPRSSNTPTSISTTSTLVHSNITTQSSSRYSPTREDLEEEMSRKKKVGNLKTTNFLFQGLSLLYSILEKAYCKFDTRYHTFIAYDYNTWAYQFVW